MKGIPVLMYHALEDEDHPAGAKDPGEQLYVLQVRQFREQMEYLHREGFRTFLLEELLAMDEWPKKAVVLTFDDGHVSNYTLALPILREFGFRAEFFITTGWIGTPHYMNPEQIKGLYDAGMGIGSHGVSHLFVTNLQPVEIKQEVVTSMQHLETIIGGSVNNFSAPGGRIAQRETDILKLNGTEIIFSSRPNTFNKACSAEPVPRFPIRAKTSPKDFAATVSQNRWVIFGITWRNEILKTFKKLLGNTAYEVIRNKMVCVFYRETAINK